MKDEVPFQDFPAYAEKSTSRSKGVIVFVVILLLVAAVAGGLFFLGKNKKSEPKAMAIPAKSTSPTKVPSPSASASATITASPSAAISKLDRAKLNVSVLNGSGVAGAANKTASALKTLGYVIGATANADKFNYTGITVVVKKSKSDYGELLKKDLSDQGAVTVTVDDTIPTDAQVIIGK